MHSTQPITILCIDDEEETLRLRRQLLELYGYRVVTASSGADGLQLLSDGRPVDLVLLDYIMPGMNGEQVVEELRRSRPAMPIVIMSGFLDIPAPLLSRVDGYVRKGQDAEVVLGAITSALTPKRRSG